MTRAVTTRRPRHAAGDAQRPLEYSPRREGHWRPQHAGFVPQHRTADRVPRRLVVAAAGLVVLLLALLAASGPPSRVDARSPVGDAAAQLGVAPGKLRTVAQWEATYLADWDGQHEKVYVPLSRQRDAWAQYELAYALDEATALYRATGRDRYLDRAFTYVENVIATARPSWNMARSQYHDQYRGWVSARADTAGQEVPLPESYFWRYATTLLRVVKADPSALARHRDSYDAVLAFARGDIFGKWYARGAEQNIYRSRTHVAVLWAQIAANLAVVDPGSTPLYRRVADRIDADLRRQLRANPAASAAYFWSDRWGRDERPGQDVAHGNGVVAHLIETAGWSRADLDRVALLLTKVIWPSPGVFHAYLDGTGKGTGWFADGFVKLGRLSPAVQWRLERHTVVNGQFVANLALNAKLLSEGRAHT